VSGGGRDPDRSYDDWKCGEAQPFTVPRPGVPLLPPAVAEAPRRRVLPLPEDSRYGHGKRAWLDSEHMERLRSAGARALLAGEPVGSCSAST